jgi:hypothetical protein
MPHNVCGKSVSFVMSGANIELFRSKTCLREHEAERVSNAGRICVAKAQYTVRHPFHSERVRDHSLCHKSTNAKTNISQPSSLIGVV